ncbi:hypothetical protein C5167_019261 [Papaver somniferum]|uniref:Uncharacterized protein n=1 Tax=Papaver somniferum TaxID=3469 RepID=A0A4Y7IRS5_PAPSO|nr:hypothetical protein C5167_019261 [Papaver somniferum]
MAVKGREMNYDFASPCSSPPTPSSPLPVSVDVGQERMKWLFLECCRMKWLFLKCCNWCSRLTALPSKPEESDHPFEDSLHWKL